MTDLRKPRVSDERLANIFVYIDSPERQGYPVPTAEFELLMLDLRDSRARIEELSRALRENVVELEHWGRCTEECGDNQGSCNCGFEAALERLRRVSTGSAGQEGK
jgi:hypothetical protein